MGTTNLSSFTYAILLVLTGLICWSNATGISEAAAAMNGMMSGYNSSTGLWDSSDHQTAWWQSAIALQACLDFMIATGTHDYLRFANYTINAQRKPVSWWPQGGGDFRADSTDDTGWWSLALLTMYSITGEEWLLDIAIADEAYMAQYWTTECGGGLIWQIRDLSYKAAISNELYIELTASLHNLIPNDEFYLSRSLLAWNWFRNSGMLNKASLINDGLMSGPAESCVNNNAETWTYNQGVILGGLVKLFTATGDRTFLDEARNIADAVIVSSHLAPQGILTEPCEECAIPDQYSFKGIFIRHLAVLNSQLTDRPYNGFIQINAASVYTHDRQGGLETDLMDLYGLRWQGPYDKNSLGSQQSALMLLTAVLWT